MKMLSAIIEINQLVNSYFNNVEKTTLWLNCSNPLLGDVTPMDMILAGRSDKLKLFIENQLAGNFP